MRFRLLKLTLAVLIVHPLAASWTLRAADKSLPHRQLVEATDRLGKLYQALLVFSIDHKGYLPLKLSELVPEMHNPQTFLTASDHPPQGVNNLRNDPELLAKFVDSEQYPVIYSVPEKTHLTKLPKDFVLARTRPQANQSMSVVLHPDGSIEALNAPPAATLPADEFVLLKPAASAKTPTARPSDLEATILGAWCFDFDGGDAVYEFRKDGTFTQTIHLTTKKMGSLDQSLASGDWKLDAAGELAMTNRASDSDLAQVGEVETAGIVAADASTMLWSNRDKHGKSETLTLRRAWLLKPGKHDRPIVGSWESTERPPGMPDQRGTMITLADSGEATVQTWAGRRTGRWAQRGDWLAIEIDSKDGSLAALETLEMKTINANQIQLGGHLSALESSMPSLLGRERTETFRKQQH